MKYARVEGVDVLEVVEIDGDINGRYHPSIRWTPCAAEVSPGWTFDGAVFSPPTTAPMPEVVEQPPQLSPAQIAVLADFFKTNPAIAQALGL